MGGQRVPESMPTVYDASSFQEPVTLDYGPEYNKTVELRDNWTELKKIMSKMT